MNPIKPGETVLVQGTGGVSLFALQLGAAFGARVIVTSSSEEKLDRVKAMGAWKTINYKQRPDWDREVLALTNGKGVSRILEMAGGDEVQRSMNALANGGQMVLIGFLQGTFLKIDILPFLMKGGAIHGVSVGHRKAFEAMNAALAMDEIHPVIDGVYSFEQTPSAFTHLGRGAFGKIVIEFPK
jgi:NADPH:quinone reductase-like Zn-dependent oxidoreductase